jgi:hypothetical protein
MNNNSKILTNKRSRLKINKYDDFNSSDFILTNNFSSKENIQNSNINNLNETFQPEFKLDFNLNSSFTLLSKKGHFTYYTKQSISKGIYYFEVEITNLNFDITTYIKNKILDEVKKKYFTPILNNINKYSPNIRIGIINEECDYEIPVGAFGKSYGYRVNDGFLLSEGNYIEGNEISKNNDIIGVLIHLKPPKPKFLKDDGEQQDLDDECYITFYINGKEQKNKIEDIKAGTYKIAITLYNFAECKLNFAKNRLKYIPVDKMEQINFFSE